MLFTNYVFSLKEGIVPRRGRRCAFTQTVAAAIGYPRPVQRHAPAREARMPLRCTAMYHAKVPESHPQLIEGAQAPALIARWKTKVSRTRATPQQTYSFTCRTDMPPLTPPKGGPGSVFSNAAGVSHAACSRSSEGQGKTL